MILNILSSLLFFIFLFLGGIHFYWAFGGNWGLRNAIPTKEGNENLSFRPSAFATLIVGIFLISIALFYLIKINFILINLPNWLEYFTWIIPLIFLIRAIGDFKYVGFFKSVKNTLFAKSDDTYFSPLCLLISILGFLIYCLD